MNYKIYANVRIGKNARIGDYVIVGMPPVGREDGELETIIGEGAIIRSHTVIYAGNQIGCGFQTGHHAMIREQNVIGDNVSIGTSSIIEHHVVINDGVRIHSQAFIPEYSTLEENAWIGPNVTITNAMYPCSPQAKMHLKGAVIGKYAKVGANSTLLPGIILGENCLVGAGSVVVRDVAAGKVVAGNPAVVINDISNLPYDIDEEI